MKSIQRFCSVLLLLAAVIGLQAQSYNKLWKQVEQAQKQSLPQTVIKLTDEIYRKGEREQNVPQVLKAYILREAYQEEITPDSLYTHLKNMERWAQAEKNPLNKAILYSLLAREYMDFMLQNRRDLLNRTLLDEEEPSSDIREWSVNQFVRRIDRYNRASLQDSVRLLQTSSKEYVPFVVLEDGSRFYQHDMYHLLASRAIATYKELNDFNPDSLVRIHINSIYQNMIDTYQRRADSEDAVILCQLNYWDWKVTDGISAEPYETFSERKEQANEEYLQTLNRLIEKYASHQVCAEVYINKAIYLRNPEVARYAEVLRTCEEGIKRYPSYKRIDELKNIKEAILCPQLSVNTSKGAYPGDSLDMNVEYRNLHGFTLNLYRKDFSEAPWVDNDHDKSFLQKNSRQISSKHIVLQPKPQPDVNLADLPYLRYDTLLTKELHVPEEVGVYILQLVPDVEGAPMVEKFLVSSRIKVLTLSLSDDKWEVVALDARSGHPIPGTQISFYSSYDEKNRKQLAEVTTDASGRAIVAWNKNIRVYVARKGEDTAMSPQRIFHRDAYSRNDDRQENELTLLTDRALYRPGQTVHVKGIAYTKTGNSARVSEGKTYQISLYDTNRKEMIQKEVRTNEFGSFATEFVLPTVCLNGNFSIDVKGSSSVSVRVEEYKRPTFDIQFNPVKQAYILGDTVRVTGTVKSYSGVAIQEIPMVYTVTRRSLFHGFGWGGTPLVSDTIQLDAKGDFSIPILLRPSEGSKQARKEAYSYQIEAVVTDDAGETQSASFSLNASRKAYSFRADVAQELCKEDSIKSLLKVENASGEVLPIQGFCRLYPIVNAKTRQLANKPVYEGTFTSGEVKDFSAWKQLPSGQYGLVLSVQGSDGKEVNNADSGADVFLLFSLSDPRPAMFMDSFFYEQNTKFDATYPASLYFGTSHKDAYVMMDIFGKNGRVESRNLALSDTIIHLEYPYQEEYGEGVTVLLTFVKNGQMYSRQVELQKHQPNRTLLMKWEVFRDRLRPGQEEEWKLVIKTPKGFPAVAEMLATMYDASLDKIYQRYQTLSVFYNTYIPFLYWSESLSYNVMLSPFFPLKSWKVPRWSFDRFYSSNDALQFGGDGQLLNEALIVGYQSTRQNSTTGNLMIRGVGSVANGKEELGDKVGMKHAPSMLTNADQKASYDAAPNQESASTTQQLLQPVTGLRTNFAETAFFYPQLRTNELGEVAFSFTMPQSLTRWNFRGYSHTKDMLTGMLDATAVTAKEFMLSPNLPRFVRVGDKTQIAAGIANLTGKALKGITTFTLFDPVTERVITTQRQNFAVAAGGTTTVSFRFEATERYDVIGVRMMADGGTFSDGEQHLLPVLSNKESLTETLAMPIRGEETRTFPLDSLFNRNSRTATNRRLTVEFTGNPAWYAVQALPVLSEPLNDNAVSWATAYYANSLAGYIANSQPRIKAVFNSWKQGGGTKKTFLSQLQQNQEVKNILLNESPWVMDATTEAEQQARIATLFDVNLLNNRNLAAFTKLQALQDEEGAWSWYKGMSGSPYVTTYITEQLVRLPQLTQEALPAEAAELKQKAFGYLHKVALEEYQLIRKVEKGGLKMTILSDATLKYLYLVAISGEEVPAQNQAAYRYYLSMIARNLKDGSMSAKAQSAIILQKAGRKAEANEFIASIKQHLVQTDDRGAHFDFYANPYAWGMMPVSVHVEVMEALRMVGGNDALVNDMKIWLLQQKQTTSWTSPIATADAIYALLCQGSNLLANSGDVRITLGNKVLETFSPAKTTVPGLGYVKETFTQGAPELKATSITVQKRDAGIAWGAVYAQYLSPIADVQQQGGALNVDKKLYVERVAPSGQKSLHPISATTLLTVGDKVVSRLTLRLDRPMDFVQLKDQRGACFEPIGSLSGYRWSNGWGYYMEVEDAATNFFFDHLAKGVYVLENSYHIARGGTYETGLATLQSAYAPEYASHSTGGVVVVK